MTTQARIRLNKYQFADLIDEVDGMCPLCAKELLIRKSGNPYSSTLAEAAHIYPHSPSAQEKITLSGVPRLSDNDESLDNLLMLCPTCHHEFDHPRTREEYLRLYNLKNVLSVRKKARAHYQKNNIETDILQILVQIENVNTHDIKKRLSYRAIKVDEKMSSGASLATRNIVTRDVREYYLEIKSALKQLEYETPGVGDLIAQQVALFYTQLHVDGRTQDDIYFLINDWINTKTQRQFRLAVPFITAFYIQNCEVFSK